MLKFKFSLLVICLVFIVLYPKFPLLGVSGTFVSIRLEDILAAILVGLFGLYAVKNRFSFLKEPLSRDILLYWFVCFTATFFGIFVTKTAQPELGLLHTLRRVEYMSLFFLAFSWLSNQNQLKFFTRAILVVSLIVAVYGLGQQFFHFPVISTNNSEYSKGLTLTLGPGARINSTFAGHYDLAAFSVFPLLLIIALLPISRHKPLLISLGLLIYWAMLLSASRITFAACIISVSLLLLIIRRIRWFVPAVMLAILGVLVTPQLRGRYMDLITKQLNLSLVQVVQAAADVVPEVPEAPPVSEDRSSNIRFQAEWPRAIRAFYKNPLVGSGFSSVGLAVDNEYLRALAESGLLGLAAFVLVIVRFLKTSLPFLLGYRENHTSAFIAAGCCFLVSLLLGATFIDIFTASKVAMMSWAIIGLVHKTKKFNV